MQPSPWLDAIRAAHATRLAAKTLLKVPPLTSRELYGAILLDAAALLPEDVMEGVRVVTHDDVGVVDAVQQCIRRVFGSEGGHGVLVCGHGLLPEAYDAAIESGRPVLIVTWDRNAIDPPEALFTADEEVSLPEGCHHDVVDSLVHAVAGGWPAMRQDDCQWLNPDHLLRCVRPGLSVEACVRNLLAVSAKARAGRDEETKKTPPGGQVAAAAKASPTPDAAPPQTHVRKLSQMRGFGTAGVWGCNLARDVQAYAKGELAWRDVDKGILLSGPPGTGKTTFAKALALECDVPLVTTVYSEWSSAAGTSGDSMGKGLNKLFDSWHKKRADGPFILFVDEIDSMGVRGGNAQNDSWFGPIINAWLAFLDGANSRDGIVVVAATNHPDRVDEGMRRPGRLDRHVELPMPDVATLAAMVRTHLGDELVALHGDDLARAARAVRGRSPAEVALLCREARRVARWAGRRVCADDLLEVVGQERVGQDPATARRVAVHEAGHAVAGVLLGADELDHVDADAGRALFKARPIDTVGTLKARMVMTLAARAAEEVLLGDVSTGAAVDLRDATAIASQMRASWGMGDAGLVCLPDDVSRHDREHRAWVRAALDDAYARATELVTGARDAVERVADALLRDRYLEGAEVRALVAGPLPVAVPGAPVKPPVRRVISRAPWLGRS